MDKYYNPTIEEFHQGFEYEIWESFAYTKENWIKETFQFVDKDGIWLGEDPTNILAMYENRGDEIRIKYLDKEDIESLGFTITKDSEEVELSLESKRYIGGPSVGDDYKIIILYGLDNKEMWIYKKCNNGYEYDLFKGLIKNKSELIKLLKQLQIG